MTQEDKDLLLKDISARLPYGVKVKLGDNPNIFDLEYRIKFAVMYGDSDKLEDILDITNIKPYLFPLSSMTVGQGQEFAATLKYLPAEEIDFWTLNTFDWCNKNHFDYRNLIGKGLAIDATRKNIY